MSKRKYNLQRRAEQQEQTRDRIVEAVIALHEELGPRHATISAIAERAGVQRLTVYRHFPDDHALFHACTSRWLERNPPPDIAAWAGTEEPAARTEAALGALYAYYRDTEQMWSVSYRDVDEVPALQAPMLSVRDYLTAVAGDLAAAWRKRPGILLRATIAHAVAFQTWQSLKDLGIADKQMARLVTHWVSAAAAPRRRTDALRQRKHL